MRPRLKPALRRLWRDSSTVQLGLTAAHAVVLSGLSANDRRLLELLDGSRDVDTLLATLADTDVERDGARRLLTTLERAGVLDDASVPSPPLGEDDRQRLEPDLMSLSLRHPGAGEAARVLDRRRSAVVAVHGAGRVGAEVTMLLAAAGVGTLACLDATPLRHADLSPGGLPRIATGTRGDVTALRAGRFTATARTTTARPERVALALLTPASSEALPEIVTSVRDEPHLLACVRETTGVIGPLVLPGRSPCLRCLALARGERDPQWPLLSAQLIGDPVTEACDVALASLVASVAALQALAFLDGDAAPAAVGGVLEYDALRGTLRRRSIAVHPACGCAPDHATDLLTPAC